MDKTQYHIKKFDKYPKKKYKLIKFQDELADKGKDCFYIVKNNQSIKTIKKNKTIISNTLMWAEESDKGTWFRAGRYNSGGFNSMSYIRELVETTEHYIINMWVKPSKYSRFREH